MGKRTDEAILEAFLSGEPLPAYRQPSTGDGGRPGVFFTYKAGQNEAPTARPAIHLQ